MSKEMILFTFDISPPISCWLKHPGDIVKLGYPLVEFGQYREKPFAKSYLLLK